MGQTLHKAERLSSRIAFVELSTKGDSFKDGSIRLRSIDKAPDNQLHQVAFSVPKRIMKRAVDRNRIKRLMRESYRQLKPELSASMSQARIQASFLFVYHGRGIPSFDSVHGTMTRLLERWIERKCAR